MSDNWTNKDLEDSLKRAFVDGKADYIIVDGHTLRNNFLKNTVDYGLEKGWLTRGHDIDEDKILGHGLGQYFAYTYRLSDKGKEYFGIKN